MRPPCPPPRAPKGSGTPVDPPSQGFGAPSQLFVHLGCKRGFLGGTCVGLRRVAHPGWWLLRHGGVCGPPKQCRGEPVRGTGTGRSRIQTWDWGNWFANYHLAADPLPAVVRSSSCCPRLCWGLKPGRDRLGWGGKGGSGQERTWVVCTKLLCETLASPCDPTAGFIPSR